MGLLGRHIGRRLALIWLAVLVPLTGVLLFTYNAWYSATMRLTEQEREGYALSVAGEFQLLLREIRYGLRVSGTEIAEDGATASASEARMEALVRSFPAAYVAFADESGRVAGSGGLELTGESVADDDAFRMAMRSSDGFGIEPSEDVGEDLVGFHVAQAIPPRPGRPAGVMMMLVDVRRLHDEFPVEVPHGGINVVDSAGQVVFQNESVRFAETRAPWGETFPVVRRALGGTVAMTSDFEFPTGGTRIGVFVPIRDLGWAAGSSIEPRAALAPFYRTLAVGGLLVVLLGMGALFVSITTARVIRRSLDRLAEDAHAIGSGRLEEPVRVEREDEIGDVARSLEAARTELLDARRRIEGELDVSQSLLHASDALASSVDLDTVLATVARVFHEVSGRSRVTVDLLDAEGDRFVVAHVLGGPDIPAGTRVPAEILPSQVRPLLEEARPVQVDLESLPLPEESASFFERLAVRYALGVPLVAHGRVLGVVGIDEPGSREEFDERTLRVAEGVGPLAAIAIENAMRYREQARGREFAETLDEISRLIHASLGSSEAVQQALEWAGATLGASAGAVFLGDGGISSARYQYGFPEGFLGSRYAGELFPFAELMVETQEPVAIGEEHLDVLMNPEVARQFGVRSLLAIPLLGRRRVVGGIGFVFGEPHEFVPADTDFARKFGASVSLALENARLYEAEHESARLKEALATIDHDIHGTSSPDEMLRKVVVDAAEALGCDSSALGLREDGQWVPRYVHGLPQEVVGRALSDEELPFAALAARTQQTVVIDDAFTDPRADPAVQHAYNVRSVMVTPLIVRDEVIGAQFFNYHEHQHTFTDAEVDFAGRLSSSLGLAIANARLFEAEHHIAETLQTAMLALPERIQGLEFASLYRSATEAARVGGDFYDLFEIEHRLAGIVVGDISGHGVDAAVLTSLVKNAIRVQATQQNTRPDQVMDTASKLLFENSPSELFATVFFGILDLDTGDLEYCNAGHTTGARVCSDGGIRSLPANSPIVGALPGREFALSTERLGVNDLLFLYTDGLTEARRGNELFGEERLFQLFSRARGGDPEAEVRAVFEEVLAFAGDVLSDDLAILALRWGGGSEQGS